MPYNGIGRAADEERLAQRVQGTVFDDRTLRSTQGLLSPDQCVDQMILLFEEMNFKNKKVKLPWRIVRSNLRLQEAAVMALQRFWAHEVRRGQSDGAMGPRPLTAQDRAQAWAYMGMQRAAGHSKRGLDHLLQPGLGREKHMEQALALPSPYKPGATVDPDLRFAALTMAIWGPYITPWRKQQENMLLLAAEAVRPLTEALRRLMPPTVARVAGKKNPAMIALTTVLMRWPDRNLACEYVEGHSIVGHIQTSGVFRARSGKEISKDELANGFLGDQAITFIDRMIARQPRKDSSDIERLMKAETAKGYQSEPVVKAAMDRKYGIGGWRPMPLFINEEAGGKQRLIANAKGGGHNEWTSDEETLFVIAVGFAADAAVMITDECTRMHLPEGTPEISTPADHQHSA